MKRLFLVTVAAAALLAGCGSPTVSTGQPAPQAAPAASGADAGRHNDTDVMFAQMMLAQYGPAAELLRLAQSRTANEKVRMLAAAVDVTQADELTTVRQWLVDWHQSEVPDAQPELHAGHGGLATTGKPEIDALAAAPAADFDRTFLNLLIAHQHQAVEYARLELGGGTNPAAMALARRVDQSRTAQITMMLELVG